MKQSRILVATVHDKPGVLTKIASIFYRRGMNIITLTVGQTAQQNISKIVFRVVGESNELKRLMLSVENMVDVVAVDIQPDNAETARELCLACIGIANTQEEQAYQSIVQTFPVNVLKQHENTVVLEMVGAPEEIDLFIQHLQPLTLMALSRTGATLIPRF
jgi:acetolactate synthase-1/3 small subunit